jgi:hypothetical protein
MNCPACGSENTFELTEPAFAGEYECLDCYYTFEPGFSTHSPDDGPQGFTWEELLDDSGIEGPWEIE